MSLSSPAFRLPRVLLATVGVLLGLSAFASAAEADCAYPDAEQVFAPWNDDAYYQLAPEGSLESGGTGWLLTGGAKLVEGNEDQYLNGVDDKTSLAIPFLGSATSPPFCVDESTPAFRLMALNTGDPNAKLRVIVSYQSGWQLKTRSTDIRATDSWQPTEPLQLDIDGDRERIARITFLPRDWRGGWQLDNLYIDPFARH